MVVASDGGVGQQAKRHAATAVVFRELRLQMGSHRFQRRFCSTHFNPRLQPAKRADGQKAPIVEKILFLAAQYLIFHAGGNPDFGTKECYLTSKSARRNADDDVRASVKYQRFPDDVRF